MTDTCSSCWSRAGSSCHQVAALIQQQMVAENAELRKDAERYRWVKGTSKYTPSPMWILTGNDVVHARRKESDIGWYEYKLPPLFEYQSSW